MTVLVTGSSGFVGSHLADALGPEVHRADLVDGTDLRDIAHCRFAMQGVTEVYHLAALMGGIGFITGNHAEIATDNTRIDLNMLEAAVEAGVSKFFYSSSACVYRQEAQGDGAEPLKESDAWPADPEPGYGLEKLYAEELLRYYAEDYDLEVRIARFHNVYGPDGTWQGGKEKAPAALCRKVAEAPEGGFIRVWGDGKQVRSFIYVEDCIEGIQRLMSSDYDEPLNLGTEDAITIGELAEMVIDISGKDLSIVYEPGPQGVRSRNSDNTLMREVLKWEPQVSLRAGMERTYEWIAAQV